MKLDIRNIPFSRFGSYSVIQLGKLKSGKQDNNLYFRDVGGGDNDLGYIFQIIINNENEYKIEANETELTVKEVNTNNQLSICFPDENRVRFFSEGLSFSFNFILNSYDHINLKSYNKWELHSYTQEMKLGITLLNGKCDSQLDWDRIKTTRGILTFTGEKIDVDVERYQCVPIKKKINLSYDEELQLSKIAFNRFKEKIPKIKNNCFEKGKDLAAYITYSIVVHPLGNLPNYAMYMSKNWMTNIWSWDNCFNALGLCIGNEKLALEQLLIFSSKQTACGILPDTMNNLYCSYSCCKPPIEGWTYLKMMALNDYFKQENQLIPIYEQLKGLENYWTQHRIFENYPLPYYNHGNDSGWDNATIFSDGMPVTSPDLPTYLIKLYEAMEKIAELLGLFKEEKTYKEKGNKILKVMIDYLWDGKSFRSYNHNTKSFITTGNSLIELIPLLLADRLPNNIVSKLLSKLINSSFITKHGIATEAIDSPLYEEKGYWRGPIWAPTTLLFVDALREVGEIVLSKKIANVFCENAQKYGMCENYDPITGQGWDDPAFAWTSNVFLLLASQYI